MYWIGILFSFFGGVVATMTTLLLLVFLEERYKKVDKIESPKTIAQKDTTTPTAKELENWFNL